SRSKVVPPHTLSIYLDSQDMSMENRQQEEDEDEEWEDDMLLWWWHMKQRRRRRRRRKMRAMLFLWYYNKVNKYLERQDLYDRSLVTLETRKGKIDEITRANDQYCIWNLRMDRDTFAKFCVVLQTRGGLSESGSVSLEEKVAMFLKIIAPP
ncbi:hypothetical protein Tsubulata_040061, partial [Turnera subulata]